MKSLGYLAGASFLVDGIWSLYSHDTWQECYQVCSECLPEPFKSGHQEIAQLPPNGAKTLAMYEIIGGLIMLALAKGVR